MKTILGTGQLRLAVMQLLLDKNPGEKILMVNRSGKLPTSIPANVQVIAADVTNKTDVEAIAKQSTVLFTCTDVAYQHWADFYPAAAKAFAFALTNSHSRLVFADNLYSYGNVAGVEMHEKMPHIKTLGISLASLRAASVIFELKLCRCGEAVCYSWRWLRLCSLSSKI